MVEAKQQQMFGFVPYPAIGYRMGGRQMVATAMTPIDYTGVVGLREVWDPLSGGGTNRKEDKAHRQRIAKYIEETEEYVLNSILVYIGEGDAKFVPDDGAPDGQAVKTGVLYVRPGAKFKVGDGGHRTGAYTDVVEAHRDFNDDVYQRLATSGQPIIVVLDDDQVRRAQDFTDLQKNAKPLSASIGQSMDRRSALNRVLIEKIIKRDDIPIFAEGRRVEFLTDTPGKLSAKTMSYKTLRYASGTLLVGTGLRDTRGWEDAVELKIASDEKGSISKIVDFWQGLGELPTLKQSLAREKGVALLRNDTWLLSANLLYAIAAAVHQVAFEDKQCHLAACMRELHDFDFLRGRNSPFVGTLVDPVTFKAVAGRGAWEGAAEVLVGHIGPGSGKN
ncbi:DNA sulfur modification protein DndB [Streptomyces sp. SBT349]|uniref:DNA sulfur modification protein DndB n=1 Tax=Streptomyces sp. SBT349 TaxID=1580539 RepID=UPI00066E8E7E|nr:DNA sulfur modification protein DndB [Streptomyces sp. SBT349]